MAWNILQLEMKSSPGEINHKNPDPAPLLSEQGSARPGIAGKRQIPVGMGMFAAFSPRLGSSPAFPGSSLQEEKKTNPANCFAVAFPQLQLKPIQAPGLFPSLPRPLY